MFPVSLREIAPKATEKSQTCIPDDRLFKPVTNRILITSYANNVTYKRQSTNSIINASLSLSLSPWRNRRYIDKIPFHLWSSTIKPWDISVKERDLNKWITGVWRNSTLIVLVPWHHDIALHSPACPPGVLDQPVVLAFRGTVANGKNSVIRMCATTGSAVIK